ncbi:NAD(P)-dependent oxidoreductase [Williamsia sterculiae]|uniref:Putative NADH-flavin reductase n=1 Tax=Williamsia sterculiae TaxID=1344003 RepID=A0A1N7HBW4_9NOCA|nr:NAD(P)H-binding protein [Williamsia sterculiae]SIS22379.1 Putative NADH-flavin reductase [Williamsia sterculiae]
MRIVVIGATGTTGRAVVAEARRRGDRVTAAARSAPGRPWPEGVEAQALDICDPRSVDGVLRDADAVVVTVGIGTARQPTQVYSLGIRNVLSAMQADTALRLAVISAVPAAPPEALSRGQRWIGRGLGLFFGATYTDMRRMEATLSSSPLRWTCLRPPRLVDRPARGEYRITAAPSGSTITHTDLACALLDVLDDAGSDGRFLFVAN